MKQSIILGAALAIALFAAPAMAGNLDAVKNAKGTSMSAAELASVEGMRRSRGGMRVSNKAYVYQSNRCTRSCRYVAQGNFNYVSQYAKVTIIKKQKKQRRRSW